MIVIHKYEKIEHFIDYLYRKHNYKHYIKNNPDKVRNMNSILDHFK